MGYFHILISTTKKIKWSNGQEAAYLRENEKAGVEKHKEQGE